ncbi:hypothetical protein BDR03DRAFT_237214 [Suillus americanus]|nr:hypothetical protein BDR03DRAFT_237214 [Suillus americanus]
MGRGRPSGKVCHDRQHIYVCGVESYAQGIQVRQNERMLASFLLLYDSRFWREKGCMPQRPYAYGRAASWLYVVKNILRCIHHLRKMSWWWNMHAAGGTTTCLRGLWNQVVGESLSYLEIQMKRRTLSHLETDVKCKEGWIMCKLGHMNDTGILLVCMYYVQLRAVCSTLL